MNHMKKLLTFVVFILLPLGAFSQVTWNVKAGLGSSGLLSYGGEDARFSFRVGGGANVPFGRGFFVNPSLYFVRKGFTFDGFYGSEQISEAHYNVRMDYLELPVNVGFRLDLGKDCGLSFYTGPYVACGLNSKARVNISNSDYKHTFSENLFDKGSNLLGVVYNTNNKQVVMPKFKRIDAGLQSGIQIDYRHLLIGAEIGIGLTHVANQSAVDPGVLPTIVSLLTFGTASPRNIVGQVMIGYRF